MDEHKTVRSLKDAGFISNIKGGKNPDGTKYSSRYEFHLPKEPEKENNVVDVVDRIRPLLARIAVVLDEKHHGKLLLRSKVNSFEKLPH